MVGNTKRLKRAGLSWDVGIGLVLLVCGLALAFWDRPVAGLKDGGALQRAATTLPYP